MHETTSAPPDDFPAVRSLLLGIHAQRRADDFRR